MRPTSSIGALQSHQSMDLPNCSTAMVFIRTAEAPKYWPKSCEAAWKRLECCEQQPIPYVEYEHCSYYCDCYCPQADGADSKHIKCDSSLRSTTRRNNRTY